MSDNETGETHRRTYHHGDLRTVLLDAVRVQLEAHGPDGVSLAQAAREVGVSSGAPYRHFKDKSAVLEAIVADGMDRLKEGMREGRDAFAKGSLEAVAGTGQAYIDFARHEPSVFRLVFSLTEGHQASDALKAKGAACFSVVMEAVALYLKRPVEEPIISRRAYMLWAFVHGHSFLMIDKKQIAQEYSAIEWDLLMDAARGFLDLTPT
ncbi:MAG: TetR/AcrR family transcriptional regulator [Pseudomonadota bacterium]